MSDTNPTPSDAAAAQASYELLSMTMIGRKGPGCRDENQDRLTVRATEFNQRPLHLLAVADGVSRCPDGAGIAEYLIGDHLALDPLFDGAPSALLGLRRYLMWINARFYAEFMDQPEMLESACTLSMALLDGAEVNCFWVGDSPIYLGRKVHDKFETTQLSVPDLSGRLLIDCFGAHAPFHVKEIAVCLAVGDVLVVASDGVADNAEEFGELLNTFGPTPELLQAVKDSSMSEEVYDDATLIMAQRIR